MMSAQSETRLGRHFIIAYMGKLGQIPDISDMTMSHIVFNCKKVSVSAEKEPKIFNINLVLQGRTGIHNYIGQLLVSIYCIKTRVVRYKLRWFIKSSFLFENQKCQVAFFREIYIIAYCPWHRVLNGNVAYIYWSVVQFVQAVSFLILKWCFQID